MRPANPFAYYQICGSRRVRQIVSLEGIPQQPIAMRREDCFFAAPGFGSSIVAYLSVVTSNVCSSSVVARPSHNGGKQQWGCLHEQQRPLAPSLSGPHSSWLD